MTFVYTLYTYTVWSRNMPSTQVKRCLTVVYEEDYVKFASRVSHLLSRGWKHISSGCNSVPVVSRIRGRTTTVETIRIVYWMIMLKNERIPIPP